MSLPKSSIWEFVDGPVFGSDIGTGSIGYAVREGDKLLVARRESGGEGSL